MVSIDNYSTGKKENEVDGCQYFDVDIRSVIDYSFFMDNPDIIYHLAYPYGVDGMGLDQAYLDTGFTGTYNLLRWAVKSDVKKFVNISSVSAYGIIKETPVTEEVVGTPYIHYGVTKRASEDICKIFKGTYGLDSVNLRLIYGDGKQLRSYTYVSDIVDGIMNSVNGKGNGEIYNISGGSVCSILELAEIVLDVTESDLEIEFAPQSEYRWSDEWVKIPLGLTAKDENGNWYDERNYVADNTKALNGFGYDPKIELKDGIKKMWDWMNK